MKRHAKWLRGAAALVALGAGEAGAATFISLGPGTQIANLEITQHPVSADGSVVVGTRANASSTEAFRWTQATGVQGLGFLPAPGGTSPSSSPSGVSSDGSTVVGTSSGQAFRWTEQGGMVGLGFLPPRTGFATESSALAVSADGSVVVGSSNGEAFRWTASTGMIGLGFLGCCSAPRTEASLVSEDGSVVVGTWSSSDRPGPQSFRWTQSQGMIDLGVLPGASSTSSLALSSNGASVAGFSGSQAFRWTESTGIQSLAPFPAVFGTFDLSQAFGISADGAVVVGAAQTLNPFRANAFRWTSGTGPVALDQSGFASSARGISGDGSVVVGIFQDFTSGNGESFIWDRANGVESVSAVLSNLGINLVGWRLSNARISLDGRTIVGNGIDPAQLPEAWVAVLVCPGDADCDAVPDARDNCPGLRTSKTTDTDGNGIGNACECGDQTGDGRVNVADLIAINRAIFDPTLATLLCDTDDDDRCNVRDLIGANRRIFGQPAHCAQHPAP